MGFYAVSITMVVVFYLWHRIVRYRVFFIWVCQVLTGVYNFTCRPLGVSFLFELYSSVELVVNTQSDSRILFQYFTCCFLGVRFFIFCNENFCTPRYKEDFCYFLCAHFLSYCESWQSKIFRKAQVKTSPVSFQIRYLFLCRSETFSFILPKLFKTF